MAQPTVRSRPYQPVTPANNKYLAIRWDQQIFDVHRKKVANAKALIDNEPPHVHMHLNIKLKKLQSDAERLATIERDNRILLEKMAHIMRSGGIVDARHDDYRLRSLNKPKRQRELLRITHENLAILRRLTTKDPHYNHKKWLMEWQVNQGYLMNISKFPHPWRPNQHSYITKTKRESNANKRCSKKVKQSKQPSTQGDGDSAPSIVTAVQQESPEPEPRCQTRCDTTSPFSDITTTVTTHKFNDQTRETPEPELTSETRVQDDGVTNKYSQDGNTPETLKPQALTLIPVFEVTSEPSKDKNIAE